MELHEIPAEDIRAVLRIADDLFRHEGKSEPLIVLNGIKFRVLILEDAINIET